MCQMLQVLLEWRIRITITVLHTEAMVLPQAYTLSETLVDMLAEKAGIDPSSSAGLILHVQVTNINSYPYYEYPMEEIMKKMRPLYEQAVKRQKKLIPLNCVAASAFVGWL